MHKKFRFLVIIIIILVSTCKTKHQENYSSNIKNDTIYRYDENGTIRLISPIVDGKMNGNAKYFSEKGILKSLVTLKDGIIQGFWYEYYPSGILKSSAYMDQGKRFGQFVEFYDGYQDSMAVLKDSVWMISPYSTKIKKFEFYDLNEKVQYYRKYDENGILTGQEGRIFQATFYDTITVKKNKTFTQSWITPDISNLSQLKVKQFYVISNITNLIPFHDTIQSNKDSTVIRWSSKIEKSGEYNFKAVAYLIEANIIETDTSIFVVKVVD